MNDKVVTKITEIVAIGITGISHVRRLCDHYVMHKLCKGNPPYLSDIAYVSLTDDLKNQIHMVLQLSCISQENGMLKIEHWKKVTLTLLIFGLL